MINTLRQTQSSRGFTDATVADAMHTGVLTCPPETPITTVARMMASYRVHAIVVTDLEPERDSRERAWGVISGLDLARATALLPEEPTAAGVASTELVTVAPEESLTRAAQTMTEHEVDHLVVVDASGRPTGIISTQDLAAALSR